MQMIEFLSNMSLLLGMIIEQAVYIFLFCVAGLFMFYTIKNTPDSACTGNCNQGRNCNCKEKKDGIS
jgi:cytochrome bd-type quinol oxidase subunit 1